MASPRDYSIARGVVGLSQFRASYRGFAVIATAIAIRFNPTLRIFAKRLLAAGKHKRLIIGAVMRKLLVLAYGILRSGIAFDANYA